MKKTLFLALALVIGLTACQTKTQSNGGTEASGGMAGAGLSPLAGEIVYVRMDSLMANFTLYNLLNDSLQQRSAQVENDLTARGRSLENSMRSAQDRVDKGLVTTRQAQELQQQLMQQEQALMNYRDQILSELAEQEEVTMNRITNSILEFMKEFNADNRYKMIISTTPGGPILNADPALDVTAEAIVGLNAYYEKNKASL